MSVLKGHEVDCPKFKAIQAFDSKQPHNLQQHLHFPTPTIQVTIDPISLQDADPSFPLLQQELFSAADFFPTYHPLILPLVFSWTVVSAV